MEPLTYTEWRATEDRTEDTARQRERYQAYVAGVNFIRSQIGGLPRTMSPRFPAFGAPAFAGQ